MNKEIGTTTFVVSEGICGSDSSTRIFRIIGNLNIKIIFVSDYKDGIAKIIHQAEQSYLRELAEIIEGLFSEKSNFNHEVKKAFNSSIDLKGINFNFKNIDVSIKKENSSADEICEIWKEKKREETEKVKKDLDSFQKNPDFLNEAAQLKRKKELFIAEFHNAERTEEFQFKNEDAKNEWNKLLKCSFMDSFVLKTMIFAFNWGKFLQKEMKKGLSLEEAADDTLNYYTLAYIKQQKYTLAVVLLSEYWINGDKLKAWYNKYFNYTKEGVFNPSY